MCWHLIDPLHTNESKQRITDRNSDCVNFAESTRKKIIIQTNNKKTMEMLRLILVNHSSQPSLYVIAVRFLLKQGDLGKEGEFSLQSPLKAAGDILTPRRRNMIGE